MEMFYALYLYLIANCLHLYFIIVQFMLYNCINVYMFSMLYSKISYTTIWRQTVLYRIMLDYIENRHCRMYCYSRVNKRYKKKKKVE